MALAGFIPIVGWAGRAVKGGKGIYSAAKGISAAEQAMSTYKNVQAFSILEKTEMGIYGLLSANGLSEYVTGKDMFGNELTDQQRQACLTQSIFAGHPFVPGMAKEVNRLGQQTLNSTVQIGKQGADVSRAFMDNLGRILNTSPNAAFTSGVGNMSSYLKAESRDDVGKVSGDKSEYLSMLSGRGAVKETGEVSKEFSEINNIIKAEDIIAERVKDFDLNQHPVMYKQLSAKKMKELKLKIENRTITKAEYQSYIWNKKFAKRRDKGVVEFWKQERKRILNGETLSRNWSNEQIEDILNKKRANFNGKTLQGHHTYSASKYPHLADKGEVIYPLTHVEHFYGLHGRNYKTSLPGKPIKEIIEF